MFVYIIDGSEVWSSGYESEVFADFGNVALPAEGDHISVTWSYEGYSECGELYNIPHDEFVKAVDISMQEGNYDIFTLANWERVKIKK